MMGVVPQRLKSLWTASAELLRCYWCLIRLFAPEWYRPGKPNPEGRRIGLLMFSARFHYHETFGNILMAKSLAMRGARPVILLPGYLYSIDPGRINRFRTRCKWWQVLLALRIARLPYVVLSDRLGPEDIAICKNGWTRDVLGKDMLDRAVDANDLGWRHAQVSCLYYSPEHDAGFVEKYRICRACAQLASICARRVFAAQQFDKILVFNGKSIYSEAIAAVARDEGIAVDTWELALRKGTVIFSHGERPAAWGPEPGLFEYVMKNHAEGFREERIREFMSQKLNGHNTHTRMVRADSECDIDFLPPKGCKAILLVANIPFDTASIGRDGCFGSIGDWIAETVAHYADDPDVYVVIKPHPYINVAGIAAQPLEAYLEKVLGRVPDNATVIQNPHLYPNQRIWHLFDHVVVFNSTSATDLAYEGRKAIVVAEAFYQHQGFTLDPATREEYFAMLDTEASPKLNEAEMLLLLQFMDFLFFRAHFYTPLIGKGELKQTRVPTWLDKASSLGPGSIESLDIICNGLMHDEPYLAAD